MRTQATTTNLGLIGTKFIKLDQTTPQTVTSGIPVFAGGITSQGNTLINTQSTTALVVEDSGTKDGVFRVDTLNAQTLFGGNTVITGNRDTIQNLTIAHSTQTANIFELQTSGGSPFISAKGPTDGFDFTPGSDTNFDMFTLNVTGTPVFGWSESTDRFILNKGLILISNLNNVFTPTVGMIALGAVVHGTGAGEASLYIHRDDTVVADTNVIGNLVFSSSDGGYQEGAKIQAVVKGYWSTGITPSELRFYTSPAGSTITQQMVIDKSGNVGIGTTAPGELLDVAGNITLNHFSNGATVDRRIGLGTTGGSVSGAAHWGGIQFTESSANAQELHFWTSTGGGSGTEKMTIDEDGLVGIGTTAPGTKLEVAGDVTIADNNPYLNLRENGVTADNKNWMWIANAEELTLRVYDDALSGSSQAITINRTGIVVDDVRFKGTKVTVDGALNVDGAGDSYIQSNVGIGTTAPGELLDVAGNITLNHFSNGATVDRRIGLGTTGGSVSGAAHWGGIQFTESSANAQELHFWTSTGGGSGTEKMTIDEDGLVGIGTTAPTAKLMIDGNSDEIQTIIQAHSTQTANLTEIQSSAGAVRRGFNGTGIDILIADQTTDTAPNDDTTLKKMSLQKLASPPTNAAYIAFANNPGTDTFYLVLEEG